MSDLGPYSDPTERPIPTRDLRDAIRLDHGKLPFRAVDPASASSQARILSQAHDQPARGRVKSSYTVPIVLILIGTAMNIWIGVAGAIAFAIWIACTR